MDSQDAGNAYYGKGQEGLGKGLADQFAPVTDTKGAVGRVAFVDAAGSAAPKTIKLGDTASVAAYAPSGYQKNSATASAMARLMK